MFAGPNLSPSPRPLDVDRCQFPLRLLVRSGLSGNWWPLRNVEDAVLKTSSQRYVTIAVRMASIFAVAKSGRAIKSVLRLSSSTSCRSCGRYVTMISVSILIVTKLMQT
jgi:hypothetical protein